jgi:uncharacterized membrane protein HdeD (DUF308 family)
MGVIRAVTKRDLDTINVVTSVLALIVGVIAIVKPGSTLALDAVILGCIAAWFLVEGCARMVMAWKVKDFNKNWIWLFRIGVLGVILGVYSLVHPMAAVITAGLLIGFSFMQTGFNMLAMAVSTDKKEK